MVIDIGQIESISPRPETLRISVMKEQLPQLRVLKELARDRWTELDEPRQVALRQLVAKLDEFPRPAPWQMAQGVVKLVAGILFDYTEYHRTLFMYAAELASLVEVIRLRIREDALKNAQDEAGITIAIENAPSFDELLRKSYAHDYESQLARITLRRRSAEASDRYFEADDESCEISPTLQRFRERTSFNLQSV